MARNTLEAVFGALGAGIRGYGRDTARRFGEEQARLDRERQMERDRLADEVTVAGLLERGFGGEREVQAQGSQRARTALQMALQGATAGRGGMVPSMPMPTQVQQMAAQQARPEREAVNIAGRSLSLLETPLERAQRQRAEGMEETSIARQQELADEERRNAQRMREIQEQGRQARATAITRADSQPDGRVSAATVNAMAQGSAQLDLINEARRAIEEYPDAVGLKRGAALLPGMSRLGDVINQRVDPEGIRARQLLANLASMEIKDRSGAAVTVSEFPRLAPFIPNAYDTPEKVLENLNGLERELRVTLGALAQGASLADVMRGGEPPALGRMSPQMPSVTSPLRQEPTQRPPLDSFWGMP